MSGPGEQLEFPGDDPVACDGCGKVTQPGDTVVMVFTTCGCPMIGYAACAAAMRAGGHYAD